MKLELFSHILIKLTNIKKIRQHPNLVKTPNHPNQNDTSLSLY